MYSSVSGPPTSVGTALGSFHVISTEGEEGRNWLSDRLGLAGPRAGLGAEVLTGLPGVPHLNGDAARGEVAAVLKRWHGHAGDGRGQDVERSHEHVVLGLEGCVGPLVGRDAVHAARGGAPQVADG